jgi:putative hydrolase of HD superfamily
MLDLLEAAAILKRLPRTGWLLAGVAQSESVADHSFATALLAISMASVINQDPQASGLERPLDIGRVAQIAVVHDVAESVVTDLPRRATQLIGKRAKHEAEALAMTQLANTLPNAEFVALWQEYSSLSSPEGRLVHDADKLEMVHQALVYERAGNQNLGEFWQQYHWHYQVSEEIFTALVEARKASTQ